MDEIDEDTKLTSTLVTLNKIADGCSEYYSYQKETLMKSNVDDTTKEKII